VAAAGARVCKAWESRGTRERFGIRAEALGVRIVCPFERYARADPGEFGHWISVSRKPAHTATRHAAPARKQTHQPQKKRGPPRRVRTVFNVLGPLTNHAAPSQAGRFSEDVIDLVAATLLELVSTRVVCRRRGCLDEISLCGEQCLL